MSQDPESHELSDRSGADYWSEIKKETGFATYKEFLDKYITGLKRGKDTRSSENFRSLLDNADTRYWSYFRCSLFDLSQTGSLSTSFFLESPEVGGDRYDHSTKSSPPSDILPNK